MLPFTRDDAVKHQPLDGGVYVKRSDREEELVLNIGPHHVSTHGLMRFIVSLHGEEIVDQLQRVTGAERADMEDVLATLIDLARRGYIKMEELEPEKKGIFGRCRRD